MPPTSSRAATVVVVGDGAVGLLGVLSAKQMGAERIIAMSRHDARQKLAREFGATDIVAERGDEAVARIKELTKGVGADSVLECVGTQESMMQAIGATRPGGYVGYVGVPHGVEFKGEQLFYTPRTPAWRPCPGPALPARTDRPCPERNDQPRQGLRPDAAAGSGGGRLPRDGRTAGHQSSSAAIRNRFVRCLHEKNSACYGRQSGIGLAIARQLAELGNSVLLGSRDLKAGEEAAKFFAVSTSRSNRSTSI